MQNYTELAIPLEDILLDRENPRLPGAIPQNQEEVLQLLEDDYIGDISSLAHSIVSAGGLFPAEKIVVIKSPEQKYTVLEGNRRIAACIALKERNKLGTLAKRIPAITAKQFKDLGLELIGAVIVEKREDADKFISNKHQGIGIKRWSPREQRKFLSAKFLDDKLSVEQIHERTLCDKSQIHLAIQTEIVLRIVFNKSLMGWTEAQFLALEKTRGITTFERILWSKSGRNYLQLRREDVDVFTMAKVEDFLGALKHISLDCLVNKNAEGGYIINSRTLNKDEDIYNDYLFRFPPLPAATEISLLGLKPDKIKLTQVKLIEQIKPQPQEGKDSQSTSQTTEQSQSQSMTDAEGEGASSSSNQESTPTTKASKTKESKFVELKCALDCPKLKQLVTEFNLLHNAYNIQKYPYAYILILRAILEHSLVYMLENMVAQNGKKHIDSIKDKAGLTELVKYCKDGGRNIVPRPIQQSLANYLDEGFVNAINWHAHKSNEIADGKEAGSHYNKLYGVLKFILSGDFNNKKNEDNAPEIDKPATVSRQ